MKSLMRIAFAASCMAAITACAGGVQNGTSPVMQSQASDTQQNGRRVPDMVPGSTSLAAHRTTGTHPIATQQNIPGGTLFVVDYNGGSAQTGAVQLYKYPSGKYIGELSPPPSGFAYPEGACSDPKGNVYIVNNNAGFAGGSIVEYSHAGKYMRVLADPGGFPVTCAIDPNSGDLAVANNVAFNYTAGGVEIYKKGKLPATLYSEPSMFYYLFAGYDGSGTLYVDGLASDHSTFEFGSLRGGSFTNITLQGATVAFPGFVGWSTVGQTMNVGDQLNAVAYQVDASGKVTGSTPLTASGDIVGATIDGSRLIGPDAQNRDVRIFAYPSGGSPLKTFGSGQFSEPIGTAVSRRTKG
ncbi:MAG TPA: hypothetical protein VGF18_08705 [Candidatus Tumulicola sp.]|jgi:hypothetical protein